MRTLHADVTGKLGDYGITSPLATEGIGVNIGFEHRSDHELLQPDAAEESQLLSGFGSAVAPIDASMSVAEEFIELRAPLMQDQAGRQGAAVRYRLPPFGLFDGRGDQYVQVRGAIRAHCGLSVSRFL